jgi:hypothetical protein
MLGRMALFVFMLLSLLPLPARSQDIFDAAKWGNLEKVRALIDTLPFPTRVYGDFALSPDGRRLAARVAPPTGRAQLWFLELQLGRERRWAAEQAVFARARWDASSRWVVARGLYGSRAMLRRVHAVAASLGDTLYDGPVPPTLEALLPDGRLLLSYRPPGSDNAYLTALTEEEVAVLDTTASGRPRPLIVAPGHQWYGRVSPDGRWLAYTSTESGRYEVYAVRFPVTGPSLKLSISGGEQPEWSPRGDGLFYRDGQRWYWVRLIGSADRPFGEPELFLEGDFLNVPGAEYAVSPDGQRLLLLQRPGERTTTTLNVVTNWFHEVGQRLRTQDNWRRRSSSTAPRSTSAISNSRTSRDTKSPGQPYAIGLATDCLDPPRLSQLIERP